MGRSSQGLGTWRPMGGNMVNPSKFPDPGNLEGPPSFNFVRFVLQVPRVWELAQVPRVWELGGISAGQSSQGLGTCANLDHQNPYPPEPLSHSPKFDGLRTPELSTSPEPSTLKLPTLEPQTGSSGLNPFIYSVLAQVSGCVCVWSSSLHRGSFYRGEAQGEAIPGQPLG